MPDDRVYRNCATRMILAMQPGEDDELLEWRHCATCQTPTDPCACSGASWPSVVVRAAIDEAYRAGREHAREATDAREQAPDVSPPCANGHPGRPPMADVPKEAYHAALRLIADLVDKDNCWFDHHGGCQAHGYLSLEPGEKCPHQEAKELLAAHPELEATDAR